MNNHQYPCPSCGELRFNPPCRSHRLCTKCRNKKASKRGRESNFFKHGMHKSPEWVVWQGMKQRCLNPNHHAYAYYGGRGIKVCDQWRDDFERFLADMGPRPLGTCIDRINNNGDYEPGNCRWVDMKIQSNNRRPRNVSPDQQKEINAKISESLKGKTCPARSAALKGKPKSAEHRKALSVAARKRFGH